MVREAAIGVCHSLTFRPEVAMPPEASVTTCALSPVRGFSTSISNGLASDREATDSDVPSAVDDEAPVVAEAPREQVGRQALAGAARVEGDPGGTVDDSARGRRHRSCARRCSARGRAGFALRRQE